MVLVSWSGKGPAQQGQQVSPPTAFSYEHIQENSQHWLLNSFIFTGSASRRGKNVSVCGIPEILHPPHCNSCIVSDLLKLQLLKRKDQSHLNKEG